MEVMQWKITITKNAPASRAAAITPAVPRAQIIITRTANPVRLPRGQRPQAARKTTAQHRKPQRRRAPQPQQAAASNAVNAAAPAPVQRPRSPQRRSYKQHYYDASTPAVPMHICPLGGLGEVGKNITLYECQGDMILVDCGLVFPDSDMFGVDLVIPDFTYVLENKDRIKGLFITHGHEDHIGSLPYLLKKFNVPIYTARLTIGLIKNKLEEHGLASSAEFHEDPSPPESAPWLLYGGAHPCQPLYPGFSGVCH